MIRETGPPTLQPSTSKWMEHTRCFGTLAEHQHQLGDSDMMGQDPTSSLGKRHHLLKRAVPNKPCFQVPKKIEDGIGQKMDIKIHSPRKRPLWRFPATDPRKKIGALLYSKITNQQKNILSSFFLLFFPTGGVPCVLVCLPITGTPPGSRFLGPRPSRPRRISVMFRPQR